MDEERNWKADSDPYWHEGYEEGYKDAKEAGHHDSYDEGYEQGYEVGKIHGFEAGRDEGYQEGYDDGERMLYSKDNPLEVISDMEHEINLTLTAPTTHSYEETLRLVQNMCQKMLKDWGQFLG